MTSSSFSDFKGKTIIFEICDRGYNIFLPNTEWRTIPDQYFSEVCVTLYVEEERKGKKNKRKELAHIDYQLYPSYRTWLKDDSGVIISSVYVEEEYRGKGFGTYLLDFTLKNIDLCHGWPVSLFADNYCGDVSLKKLQEWYERFGFKKVDGRDDPKVNESTKS